MGSLDKDSLFTIICYKEIIKIFTNQLFKNNETVHALQKRDSKI